MAKHNRAVLRKRAREILTAVVMLFAWLSHPATTMAQPRESLGLEPGAYPVGFRLFAEQDRSRSVAANNGTATYPRPIRVYVWYPAVAAGKPMPFGRYAVLADDDVWPAEMSGGARDVLRFSRGPLPRSLQPSAFAALLTRPMRAAENAGPAAGRFPLIAIGQGLYYESPIALAALAEFLAGRGFVVVSVPLVGTASPLVRIDAEDLETQVRDLEFAIARARQLPFVSGDRLGVLGFDMGGMAGLLLTMRNRDVDAFASLDSGIFYPHPSGLPQASPSYNPAALRVSWLHAAPLRLGARPQNDVKSLFDMATASNRYLLVTNGMEHVDFTIYALIDGRRAMPNYWGDPPPDAAHRQGIVADYVAHFFAAFLRDDAAGVAWLARDPADAFPGAQLTLGHRAATPASIGYDELVQDILNGGAEAAIARLRASDRIEDKHSALDQAHLERLAVSVLYTWGLAKDALPFLRYLAERYPDSFQAQAMLADAYAQLEDYVSAIGALSKFVDQHPDRPGARARLEQLRAFQSAPRK
jgi:dienelactone hydrolase